MAEVTEQQDELSVETAFQELDRLADRLEDQETSLEESFALYKRNGIVKVLQRETGHSREKNAADQ